MMENISSIFIFHFHFHLKELLTCAIGYGISLSWSNIADTVKILRLADTVLRIVYFVTTLKYTYVIYLVIN